MNSKRQLWDGECAAALRKWDRERLEKLRQRVEEIRLRRTIWDYYQDQRGGSCNGY